MSPKQGPEGMLYDVAEKIRTFRNISAYFETGFMTDKSWRTSGRVTSLHLTEQGHSGPCNDFSLEAYRQGELRIESVVGHHVIYTI